MAKSHDPIGRSLATLARFLGESACAKTAVRPSHLGNTAFGSSRGNLRSPAIRRPASACLPLMGGRRVISMGEVIRFPQHQEFGRLKAAPQRGEPFVQKWRKTLPPWMNRFLDAASLYGVVRFERAPRPDEPTQEDEQLVRKIAANLWTVERTPRGGTPSSTVTCTCRFSKQHPRKKTRVRGICANCGRPKKPAAATFVKVELKGQKWTCSCPGWRKNRSKPCAHIKRVKRKEGLGDDYSTARRREPTRYVYPPRDLCDETRMTRARGELPHRIPQIVADLCRLLIEDRRRHSNGGAIGTEDRVIVLALTMRSLLGRSYAVIRQVMEDNGTMRELGHTKDRAPCENTFSKRTGEPVFVQYLRAMMAEAVSVFRRLDHTVVGDSHDTPCIMVSNSRDQKAGTKPPSYRSDAPMVRCHFVAGQLSHAFYAIQGSLNRGPGAADNAHFPYVMRTAKTINPDVDDAAFDKGYSSKRNFHVAEELDVNLFIREKINEDRVKNKAEWGPMAASHAQQERNEDPAFEEPIRFRSLGESPQADVKRRKPQTRSRRRSSDPVIDLAAFSDLDDDAIAEMGESKIAELHEAAEANVGWARLAELFADALVHTLVCIVRWEWRLERRVEFGSGWSFPPIITIKEADVSNEPAAQALLRKIELERGHNRNFEFRENFDPNNGPS